MDSPDVRGCFSKDNDKEEIENTFIRCPRNITQGIRVISIPNNSNKKKKEMDREHSTLELLSDRFITATADPSSIEGYENCCNRRKGNESKVRSQSNMPTNKYTISLSKDCQVIDDYLKDQEHCFNSTNKTITKDDRREYNIPDNTIELYQFDSLKEDPSKKRYKNSNGNDNKRPGKMITGKENYNRILVNPPDQRDMEGDISKVNLKHKNIAQLKYEGHNLIQSNKYNNNNEQNPSKRGSKFKGDDIIIITDAITNDNGYNGKIYKKNINKNNKTNVLQKVNDKLTTEINPQKSQNNIVTKTIPSINLPINSNINMNKSAHHHQSNLKKDDNKENKNTTNHRTNKNKGKNILIAERVYDVSYQKDNRKYIHSPEITIEYQPMTQVNIIHKKPYVNRIECLWNETGNDYDHNIKLINSSNPINTTSSSIRREPHNTDFIYSNIVHAKRNSYSQLNRNIMSRYTYDRSQLRDSSIDNQAKELYSYSHRGINKSQSTNQYEDVRKKQHCSLINLSKCNIDNSNNNQRITSNRNHLNNQSLYQPQADFGTINSDIFMEDNTKMKTKGNNKPNTPSYFQFKSNIPSNGNVTRRNKQQNYYKQQQTPLQLHFDYTTCNDHIYTNNDSSFFIQDYNSTKGTKVHHSQSHSMVMKNPKGHINNNNNNQQHPQKKEQNPNQLPKSKKPTQSTSHFYQSPVIISQLSDSKPQKNNNNNNNESHNNPNNNPMTYEMTQSNPNPQSHKIKPKSNPKSKSTRNNKPSNKRSCSSDMNYHNGTSLIKK